MADLFVSKVQIGGEIYNLKDADSRAKLTTLLGSHAVEALGAAAWLGVDSSVTSGGTGVVTGGKIKEYVDAQVAAIHKFDVVVADELPEASADTMYKLYLIPKSTTKTGNVKEEWITIRSGAEGSYTYAWERIGDTEVDLSGYVQKTQKIAGIDLADDITAAELRTGLELGALALKDDATGTGTVAGQTISNLHATGTSTGEITVTLSQTASNAALTKGDYTPAGSVSGSVTAAGSVSITKDNVNGIQISGSVSAPTLTITPATDSIKKVTSVGTAATFTEGAFNQGSLPSFTQGSKAAWSATVSAGEVLSFSFTANGDDTWDAGALPTKAADTFVANELPTLATEGTSVVTGIQSATAAAPVFTGDKYIATFAGTSTDISAEFSGETAPSLVVTAVSYDKASINTATFTGKSIDLAVDDVVVAAKDVTITVE